MAGDKDNASILSSADVYVADLATAGPTDLSAAWPAGWDAVGLLHTDGITESRDEDWSDHYALGGILVRHHRSTHKRTFTFRALEDNAVTFALAHPGSTEATAVGVTTRTIKIPTPLRKSFGFEFVEGDKVRRIIVPEGEVSGPGEVVENDGDLRVLEFEVTVYPDADTRELYTELVPEIV